MMVGAIVAGFFGAASLGAGTLGAIDAGTATARPAPSDSPRPACSALPALPAQPTAPAASTGPPTDRTVIPATVSVPPVVRVVVDPRGIPYAVSTNTGMAPSCADYVVAFDGRYDTVGHLADLRLVNEIVGLQLGGSWSPGHWHLIPASGGVEVP